MQRKIKAIKRAVPVSSLSSVVQIILIAVHSYLKNWWEKSGPGDREGWRLVLSLILRQLLRVTW